MYLGNIVMRMNNGILIESQHYPENTPYIHFSPSDPSMKELCFSKEECQLLIDMYRNGIKYVGEIFGGRKESVRSVNLVDVNFIESNDWIYRKIITNVYNANEKWWNFDISGIEQKFMIGKYKKKNTGKYLPHTDYSQIGMFPRKITVIVQLTDPNKYEGCSTKLFYQESPEVVSKELGSMTMFPSYTLHEVEPVTKGSRYAMFGWIYGPHWK